MINGKFGISTGGWQPLKSQVHNAGKKRRRLETVGMGLPKARSCMGLLRRPNPFTNLTNAQARCSDGAGAAAAALGQRAASCSLVLPDC